MRNKILQNKMLFKNYFRIRAKWRKLKLDNIDNWENIKNNAFVNEIKFSKKYLRELFDLKGILNNYDFYSFMTVTQLTFLDTTYFKIHIIESYDED